ncbi:MAG: hypothetical protein ABI823_19920 [Bryobacteraceae bacterium]
MQWCLHVTGPRELAGDLTLAKAAPKLAAAFGDAPFTHVAYGTEFCENLIASGNGVRATYEAARDRGLHFTLLTPYAGERGIDRIREQLAALPKAADAEFVFNDWGALNLARRDYAHLTPVQGRLLNKSLRDPRVTTIISEASLRGGAGPTESLDALQRANLDNPSYTNFLGRFGVKAVEMDWLPQGTDLSFADRGVRVTVYAPYGFISTARICMAAALHYRKPEKFQPGAPCRHECQSHDVTYTYTNSPFQNRDQEFLLKGNTYFYEYSDAMIAQMAEQAKSGRIARIVVQSALPMFAEAAA